MWTRLPSASYKRTNAIPVTFDEKIDGVLPLTQRCTVATMCETGVPILLYTSSVEIVFQNPNILSKPTLKVTDGLLSIHVVYDRHTAVL